MGIGFSPGCECCIVCDLCKDGSAPSQLQVDISGIVAAGCIGGDCLQLNGSFLLAYGNNCNWSFNSSSVPFKVCAFSIFITAQLTSNGAGGAILTVTIAYTNSTIATFILGFASLPDCMAFNLDVPNAGISGTTLPEPLQCDGSAATCHVKAA